MCTGRTNFIKELNLNFIEIVRFNQLSKCASFIQGVLKCLIMPGDEVCPGFNVRISDGVEQDVVRFEPLPPALICLRNLRFCGV